jgi:hypothetical protein
MPFASHLAMSVGFFMGILPAVTLVFLTLKEYDEYYEDKHFFFAMVVGLFIGIMTAVIYYWSIIYLSGNLSLLPLLIIIIGFSVYEMLLLSIILSMKRFGVKFDLTFYGVVLGGCMAGVIVMFCIYLYLFNRDPTGPAILSMILLVPTLPLLYISLGAIVGFGICQGQFYKYSALVVVLKSIFNVVFIFWFISFLYWPERGWDVMIFGLIFAVLLYIYTTREFLPATLPEAQARHLRRQKRRQKLK